MKKASILASIAFFASATAVVAQPTSKSEADEKQQEEAKQEEAKQEVDGQRKICRTERMTGSRTRVNRICMTQAEWDELAAATKRDLDEMGRNAAGGQEAGPVLPGGN